MSSSNLLKIGNQHFSSNFFFILDVILKNKNLNLRVGSWFLANKQHFRHAAYDLLRMKLFMKSRTDCRIIRLILLFVNSIHCEYS